MAIVSFSNQVSLRGLGKDAAGFLYCTMQVVPDALDDIKAPRGAKGRHHHNSLNTLAFFELPSEHPNVNTSCPADLLSS